MRCFAISLEKITTLVWPVGCIFAQSFNCSVRGILSSENKNRKITLQIQLRKNFIYSLKYYSLSIYDLQFSSNQMAGHISIKWFCIGGVFLKSKTIAIASISGFKPAFYDFKSATTRWTERSTNSEICILRMKSKIRRGKFWSRLWRVRSIASCLLLYLTCLLIVIHTWVHLPLTFLSISKFACPVRCKNRPTVNATG